MPYWTEVLADSPVAYWRCDEASGTNANDEVGTLDATLTGAVFAPGKLGNGITYDGVDDRSSHTVCGALGSSLDNAATVEMWIKVPSGATAGACFLGSINTGTNTLYQGFLNTAASGSDFQAGSGITAVAVRGQGFAGFHKWHTSGLPYDGQWHHLAVVHTGLTSGAVQFYVDGVAVTTSMVTGSGGNPAPPADFEFPLMFGCRNNRGTPASFAAVSLDEIAVYTSALSAARVAAHYNAAGAVAVDAAVGSVAVAGVAADAALAAISADASVDAVAVTGVSAEALLDAATVDGAVGAVAVSGVAAEALTGIFADGSVGIVVVVGSSASIDGQSVVADGSVGVIEVEGRAASIAGSSVTADASAAVVVVDGLSAAVASSPFTAAGDIGIIEVEGVSADVATVASIIAAAIGVVVVVGVAAQVISGNTSVTITGPLTLTALDVERTLDAVEMSAPRTLVPR